MVASRSARVRKAAVEAGAFAQVTIDLGADDQFVYKVRCTTCRAAAGRSWSTYRRGEENGYLAAMDRWIFHLREKHPDAEAPCLAFLPAAEARLHQRRSGNASS